MSLSLTGLRAVFAQNTSEVFLACLKIEHDDLDEPLLFVLDRVDLVRGGDTYLASSFHIGFPDDTDEEIPRPELSVYSDPALVAKVRSLTSSPTLTVDVVLASSPTTVEYGPFVFVLRKCDYDASMMTFELGYEVDLLDMPANKWLITPATAPGSF